MSEFFRAALAAKVKQQEEQQAYTIAQFCAAFGIGRTSLYEELEAGRLASYLVGRRRYISLIAARDWQRKLEAETATSA